MKPIYLDYNATTPIAPEVRQAILPYLEEHFGNPSSGHIYGEDPAEAMYTARERVAACLGARFGEILFTSGGTESNNHAILGVCHAMRDRGRHVIVSAFEHPAVENVARWLQSEGWEVSRLPVDAAGLVDPSDLRREIRPHTVLVSVMLANNEVGTLEPIAELAAIARERGVLMHTDAAQAVGKVPVNVNALGVDLLTVAGHKLYAPKGVGALYVRQGTPLGMLMHGAKQELGRRPGTENVPYAVALGMACELAANDLPAHAAHMRAMRDRLHKALVAAGTQPRLNGHPELRLPNTLSVGFAGLIAADLLLELDADVACSAGSACHTGMVEISPVLQAMGTPETYAVGTLRLSTGRYTTEEEIDRAAGAVARAVNALRAK